MGAFTYKGECAAIALGGNIGDVLGTFRRALNLLSDRVGSVTAVSAAYRTAAVLPAGWSGGQDDYWNAVCLVDAARRPGEVLAELHEIERLCGRVRGERWAPRTLDLDLLTLGAVVSDAEGLRLPHPQISGRIFVLRPLCEIWPGGPIAGLGCSPGELLEALPDADDGIREVLPSWINGP